MAELGIPDTESQRYNRKVWEWCYILEAFQRSGLLQPGSRALGFGVGRERIAAILASRGVRVVGTDQPEDGAGAWVTTGQHSRALADLRYDEVCPQARFDALVEFRPVDMTDVPEDLTGFDLVWSSCAFEHLGSPADGLAFVERSLRCLRPGGTAVHTTEFAIDRDDDVAVPGVVLYARPTLERLVRRLRAQGHDVVARFDCPRTCAPDRFVDEPPYQFHPYHLRLRVAGVLTTSFGLVISKRRA
jgi:SAM-dependent methyltransferase